MKQLLKLLPSVLTDSPRLDLEGRRVYNSSGRPEIQRYLITNSVFALKNMSVTNNLLMILWV